MCRKVLSIFLSLAVAATMAGCGSAVLPVEEQEEPAPTATPVATDATGIDLVDIVNAQSYDAQVNRHVKLDVASLPDMNKQSFQGTELKSNDTPDTPADKR